MIGYMPMDIDDWLRGLGLEQYAASFRDNDIDADILPELTAEDLAGLGVASIGHRRKLLAAISALRGVPEVAPAASQPPRATQTNDRQGAERRLLTTLFCDVVGSTELATNSIPRICAR